MRDETPLIKRVNHDFGGGIFLYPVLIRRTDTVTVKSDTLTLFCSTQSSRLMYSVCFPHVYFCKNSRWIFNLLHVSKCYMQLFKMKLKWASFPVNVETEGDELRRQLLFSFLVFLIFEPEERHTQLLFKALNDFL